MRSTIDTDFHPPCVPCSCNCLHHQVQRVSGVRSWGCKHPIRLGSSPARPIFRLHEPLEVLVRLLGHPQRLAEGCGAGWGEHVLLDGQSRVCVDAPDDNFEARHRHPESLSLGNLGNVLVELQPLHVRCCPRQSQADGQHPSRTQALLVRGAVRPQEHIIHHLGVGGELADQGRPCKPGDPRNSFLAGLVACRPLPARDGATVHAVPVDHLDHDCRLAVGIGPGLDPDVCDWTTLKLA
mmetsp:Transcript_106056/g.182978  ORF Transcript_106056/g.182978 Transcript_106056/m.182978 type:complete len:238 (+) Transcript_106056:1135-1848(+)